MEFSSIARRSGGSIVVTIDAFIVKSLKIKAGDPLVVNIEKEKTNHESTR